MSKKKTEEQLTEKEILEILRKRLIKGDYVKELCTDLEISDYDLFGYIKQLKDLNLNISITNNTDDMFIAINNSPDYTKENSYTISEPVDEQLKIGVISDLRFGSKNEQIAMINDMYKKQYGIRSQLLVCYKMEFPDDFPVGGLSGRTLTCDIPEVFNKVM